MPLGQLRQTRLLLIPPFFPLFPPGGNANESFGPFRSRARNEDACLQLTQPES